MSKIAFCKTKKLGLGLSCTSRTQALCRFVRRLVLLCHNEPRLPGPDDKRGLLQPKETNFLFSSADVSLTVQTNMRVEL